MPFFHCSKIQFDLKNSINKQSLAMGHVTLHITYQQSARNSWLNLSTRQQLAKWESPIPSRDSGYTLVVCSVKSLSGGPPLRVEVSGTSTEEWRLENVYVELLLREGKFILPHHMRYVRYVCIGTFTALTLTIVWPQ